jgi:hypothetical protein
MVRLIIALRLYSAPKKKKKNSNVLTCKMGYIIKECDTCMENSNIVDEFLNGLLEKQF